MQIDSLISLRNGVRLLDVVTSVDPTAFLGGSLYRLADGVYLQTSKYRNNEFIHSVDSPFVTGVLFVSDDGAAKRVSVMSVEDDAGAPLPNFPGILPRAADPEYGSILSELKRMQPKVCQETASYRIALDGEFVHRTIETESYTFYFRGSAFDDSEPPYAVLHKLKR